MCSAISHACKSIDVANPLYVKEPLICSLKEEEKKHLFHQAGRISRFVRTSMFFPFSIDRSKQKPLSTAQLFWETSFFDRDYPFKKEIREHFDRFEQVIEIEKNGKKLQLKCLVIEPKNIDSSAVVANHMIVQGNTSNLDNNTPGIVPFLEGYLKEREKNKDHPLSRFVVFNHYDNQVIDSKGNSRMYLPGDLDEWGFLFKKTLETLTGTYGRFQSISAHSLGNIPTIAQLKHFSTEEFETLFPKTFFLSKGPSSFYEVSKNIPFQCGIYPWGWLFIISPILYILAKFTGWTLELDQTLVDFFKKALKEDKYLDKLIATNVIISEVKHDYYFPGKASLCASKKIDELEKLPLNVYRVSFNPPPTRTTKQGQHNYNPGSLQRQYLYKEKLTVNKKCSIEKKCPLEIFQDNVDAHFHSLKHGDSLPDLVIRTSKI